MNSLLIGEVALLRSAAVKSRAIHLSGAAADHQLMIAKLGSTGVTISMRRERTAGCFARYTEPTRIDFIIIAWPSGHQQRRWG